MTDKVALTPKQIKVLIETLETNPIQENEALIIRQDDLTGAASAKWTSKNGQRLSIILS